jgi:hypothetical protein
VLWTEDPTEKPSSLSVTNNSYKLARVTGVPTDSDRFEALPEFLLDRPLQEGIYVIGQSLMVYKDFSASVLSCASYSVKAYAIGEELIQPKCLGITAEPAANF